MANPSKIQAEVYKIHKYSEDVIEYTFKPIGRVPRFKAGQFLHLALDPYDPCFEWPDSRVFSIASGSINRDFIRIIISVKGVFTKRMKEELYEGSEVWLKLPYGEFTLDSSDENIVLIAGGTGVAPFISFLETISSKPINAKVKLYYGIRSVQFYAFEKFLQECKNNNVIELVIYNSQQEQDDLVEARSGMLDIKHIYQESEPKSKFYLSGPWAMIESFHNQLVKFGIEQENIIIDQW